jgi:4-oxalocrotonate tautomerase
MPHLDIRYAAPDHVQVDEAGLAATFTRLTGERLGKRAEVTAVRIARGRPQDWFIGGRRPAEAGRATAHVRIQITRGTNSDAEKAAFIGAAYDALGAAIAGLDPTAYVAIEEIDAGAWGYGGRTQAARRADRDATADAPQPSGNSVK